METELCPEFWALWQLLGSETQRFMFPLNHQSKNSRVCTSYMSCWYGEVGLGANQERKRTRSESTLGNSSLHPNDLLILVRYFSMMHRKTITKIWNSYLWSNNESHWLFWLVQSPQPCTYYRKLAEGGLLWMMHSRAVTKSPNNFFRSNNKDSLAVFAFLDCPGLPFLY